MANKYLNGGALNPVWCEEEDIHTETERIMDGLKEIFESEYDVGLNINLSEGISITLSNKKPNSNQMCNIVDMTDRDYESKFNFIKQHSDDPDDLKLAREIIGLK